MPERSDLDILGELGVEPIRKTVVTTTPREARIVAGFEDIQKFAEEHGRPPAHGADRDIFERLYAVRLDRLRAQPECMALLEDIDHQGLLSAGMAATPAELDDVALLAELGVEPEPEEAITTLRHVRSQADIKAAEEIAERKPCADFDAFAPLFEAAREDVANGIRKTRRFERKSEIEAGRFFIVDGLTAYVADAGDEFTNASGNRDSRLRVVFENGTESNLLARSLQKALTQDEAGRRITEPKAGPLFEPPAGSEGTQSGTIYVLRSDAADAFIVERREIVHKIGVTGGDVERRFANAEKEPAFLMAPVEVVATFRLYDIDRTRLENLLHRVFAAARLDVTIHDRLGNPIRPREWFLVPLEAIEMAVARIEDRSLHRWEYRPDEGRLVARE